MVKETVVESHNGLIKNEKDRSLKPRIDVLIEVYTQCYSNQRKKYPILTEGVACS